MCIVNFNNNKKSPPRAYTICNVYYKNNKTYSKIIYLSLPAIIPNGCTITNIALTTSSSCGVSNVLYASFTIWASNRVIFFTAAHEQINHLSTCCWFVHKITALWQNANHEKFHLRCFFILVHHTVHVILSINSKFKFVFRERVESAQTKKKVYVHFADALENLKENLMRKWLIKKHWSINLRNGIFQTRHKIKVCPYMVWVLCSRNKVFDVSLFLVIQKLRSLYGFSFTNSWNSVFEIIRNTSSYAVCCRLSDTYRIYIKVGRDSSERDEKE